MRRLLRRFTNAVIEWLNRTEPIQCTGASASWCPVCGDCVCKNPEDSRADDECPLHSSQSTHAEAPGETG
jgi:hypothetical protein